MSSFPHGRKILITGALAALLGTVPACVTTSDFDRLRSQVYSQEQERIKQQERITQLESELARSQPAQANNWAEVNSLRSDDVKAVREWHEGVADLEMYNGES